MDQLKLNFIVTIIFVIAFGLMFILLPVKKSQFSKKSGKLVMPLAKNVLIKVIVILIFAFLLIILSGLKKFRLWYQVILCGCALMGEYIAVKDLATFNKNGIYQNGILLNGIYVAFDEITSFPILQLPLEEQENYDKSTLYLTTSKNPQVQLIFNTPEECAAAVQKILELKPELKTW